MKDPRELPEHIEDLQERPIDPDRVISDDELRASGLAPVRAYVRTKAGKTAERQQRYRQKKEAEGFKQTNVQVPEEHQETIREIARKMREGEDLGLVAPAPVAGQLQDKPAEPVAVAIGSKQQEKAPEAAVGEALSDYDRKVLQVARGTGFRSRLLRLIAGA
jgi:hypothetical protein